jgi:hypothetical protein
MWIRGFNETNVLRHFQQMLGTFPFSQIRPGMILRIHAIEESEPPLFEQAYAGPAALDALIEAARNFENPDCGYFVDAWWDLWQYDRDWTLAPSGITLSCFGPLFENDVGDHLRIDLGLESHFVPRTDAPQSARMAHSNLQGLLRLVRELANALPLEKRTLWLESGQNFAERVGTAIEDEL